MSKITIVSKEEYQGIQDDALAASELLNDERFAFIRKYFESIQEYAQTSIVENTVHEVKEVVTISDKLTKIFSTPKKVQVDELSGQYKLVKKFFQDLHQFVQTKKDLDAEIEAGRVKIGD